MLLVEKGGPDPADPAALPIQVVDRQVEMDPVLRRFSLGDTEEERAGESAGRLGPPTAANSPVEPGATAQPSTSAQKAASSSASAASKVMWLIFTAGTIRAR